MLAGLAFIFQYHQWKQQNAWNLFKVNNKRIRKTSMTLLCCCIVNLEQIWFIPLLFSLLNVNKYMTAGSMFWILIQLLKKCSFAIQRKYMLKISLWCFWVFLFIQLHVIQTTLYDLVCPIRAAFYKQVNFKEKNHVGP